MVEYFDLNVEGTNYADTESFTLPDVDELYHHLLDLLLPYVESFNSLYFTLPMYRIKVLIEVRFFPLFGSIKRI